MAWTESRLEKFKMLYANNLSFLGIARELGGFAHCKDEGRNACIGMAHRLGLSSRKKVSVQGVPRIRRARASKFAQKPKPPIVSAPPLAPPHDLAIDLKHKVRFMAAEAHHCHWPLWSGDEPIEERFYCGAPTAAGLDGRPYCGPHSRMAFDGLGRGARPFVPSRAAE